MVVHLTEIARIAVRAAAEPDPQPAASARVSIDGQDAATLFAHSAPETVGVVQMISGNTARVALTIEDVSAIP